MLKPGVTRDEADESLNKMDEANVQVLSAFLAVCPYVQCRELGLDRLSLENRWDILLSLKVPILYVRELVEKTVKEAGVNTSVENGMDDYMKTMLLVLRTDERLTGVDTPRQIGEALAILKAMYSYPAFLEESFFEILVELHRTLKSKAEENPETWLLVASLEEEYKSLAIKEKFPDADITLMNHIPLAVQRKLARDGIKPEIFICNRRDPVALETIPHVENRDDIYKFLQLIRINKTALEALMAKAHIKRVPKHVQIYCSHPKATPDLLKGFIPRLSQGQLKALASSQSATSLAKEWARKFQRGGVSSLN